MGVPFFFLNIYKLIGIGVQMESSFASMFNFFLQIFFRSQNIFNVLLVIFVNPTSTCIMKIREYAKAC